MSKNERQVTSLYRLGLEGRGRGHYVLFLILGIIVLTVLILIPQGGTAMAKDIQTLLSLLLAGGALFVTLSAGRLPRAGKFLILTDIRYAGARVIADNFGLRKNGRLKYHEPKPELEECEVLVDDLAEYLWHVLQSTKEELRPGDFLAYLRASRSHCKTIEGEEAAHFFLQKVLMAALAPGAHAFLPRLFYRAETDQIAGEVTKIQKLFARDYPAVRASNAMRSDFATTVSGLTGAYVLSDGVDTRSGMLSRIVVRHSFTWIGNDIDRKHTPSSTRHNRDSRFISPYDRTHDTGICRIEPEKSIDAFLPGDYDGRVLSLSGAQTVVSTLTGDSIIVLNTAETCYRTTELTSSLKCKGLRTSGVTASSDQRVVESGAGVRINTDRTLLVNSSLSLVSMTDEQISLILVSRGTAARNAHNVLSPASGGVFEHRRGGDEADCDELGIPDLATSVIRETKEELGLNLGLSQFIPHSVFLANIQGRGAGAQGQLVATAGFMAVTSLTPSEIERERQLNADWVKGRFELESLYSVSIPRREDFADPYKAAVEYCENLHDIMDKLDVYALIGALYSGAYVLGKNDLHRAMLDVFDRAWWAMPWAGEESPHRLVIDPRSFSASPYVSGSDLVRREWISSLEKHYPGFPAAQSGVSARDEILKP